MEEEITLEEYIENYNTAIYNLYPKFFDYLNYINMSANNINWLGEQLFKDDIKIDDYSDYIDNVEMFDLASNIVESLGADYLKKFKKSFIDGTFDFYEADDNSFAYTRFNNNHFDVSVDCQYNVEDVMKLVHEFFHCLHIERFDDKLEDENCYIYTELFALVGELYAILYLYKNNFHKHDVCQYFKRFIRVMYYYANEILIQGFAMHVYDTCRSFDETSLNDYFNLTGIPEDFAILFDFLDDIDDFDFHEKATYILGFFPAYLIAQLMIDDDNAIVKFKKCIVSIKDYIQIEDLYAYFNIDSLINSNSALAKLSDDIYEDVSELLNNDRIVYHKKIGETWS